MLSRIIKLLRTAYAFEKNPVSTNEHHSELVQLFCKTNGRSNDLIHRMFQFMHGKRKYPDAKGVLGDLNTQQVRGMASSIRKDGYYVFPKKLPAAMLAQLKDFALRTPARLNHPVDGQMEQATIDRANPQAQGFRFNEQQTLEIPAMQELLTDHSLLSVVQEYLQVRPMYSCSRMWWSTTVQPSGSKADLLSQKYHFDMERVKWLKFFVYLTDVTAENGAHCYVAGTHKAGSQAKKFRKRNYARIDDNEMIEQYGAGRIREITGEAGTMFIADTRGYHRGKQLTRDDRLLLQIEFTGSLFGSEYYVPTMPVNCTPQFEQRVDLLGRELAPAVRKLKAA